MGGSACIDNRCCSTRAFDLRNRQKGWHTPDRLHHGPACRPVGVLSRLPRAPGGRTGRGGRRGARDSMLRVSDGKYRLRASRLIA